MLHPHTKLDFVSDDVGYGVFATQLIPAGTITWTLDPLDQRVPAETLPSLAPRFLEVLEHYAYLDKDGDYILCWDFARFMNHSCDPTTLAPGVDVEIAIRDILPGEQLTGDYGAYNIERDLACLCGAEKCRGMVRSSDFDVLVAEWDLRLQRAVRRLHEVEQPLSTHVQDHETLTAAATEPVLLPTSAGHRMAHPRHTAHG